MSTVSTNNWDTAFGITFADANAAIVAKKSSPASFSGKHATLGDTIEVNAEFGDWKMTGGSGSLLDMTLPLKNGTVTGAGHSETFAGSASIQVSLRFIPDPGAAATRLLKLDQEQAVTVLGVALSSGPASANDAIAGALQGWLTGNLADFGHVFAAVDLNDQADTGEFAWLKPTRPGYALNTEGATTVDKYLFGVLAMTEGRSGVHLSPDLDPAVIPDGADAGFLIASSRVVEKMFRPHVQLLFKKATHDDFDVRDDGTTLYNIKPLDLPDFTLSDGHTVTDARVDSDGFNLSIGSGSVVISFTGMTFTYKPGYTVTVSYRSVEVMATDKNGHLQLTQAGAPTVAMTISERARGRSGRTSGPGSGSASPPPSLGRSSARPSRPGWRLVRQRPPSRPESTQLRGAGRWPSSWRTSPTPCRPPRRTRSSSLLSAPRSTSSRTPR